MRWLSAAEEEPGSISFLERALGCAPPCLQQPVKLTKIEKDPYGTHTEVAKMDAFVNIAQRYGHSITYTNKKPI